MAADARLPVVLCWHMHQPSYADPLTGEYQLPWVYLHAIKDYVDMAAHLEEVPGARAVVNFVPTLLEQISDYAEQLGAWLAGGEAPRDPLLSLLATGEVPGVIEKRRNLVRALLRAHPQRMIARWPVFRDLAAMAERTRAQPRGLLYLNSRFFTDLAVWYHLAWLGETVRRGDPRVRAFVDRGCDFDAAMRRQLIEMIHEIVAGLIPRYRRLAERGQIELSVTPYAHPITPLLVDPASAREAVSDIPLPAEPHYPGGIERARWHIRKGIAEFERWFGFRPAGCWPAEGGVSGAAIRLLDEAGFAWCATGEQVLTNSLDRFGGDAGNTDRNWLHVGYRLANSETACFFRDDGLSDLIGFRYADWHADDAVANLIHHLTNIAAATKGQRGRIVAIILDGENAWEHYPENGYHFLRALYRRLADHPALHLTTFGEYLHAAPSLERLSGVVAGSWVYGTFSTWIGERDKNRGWEMLIDAKKAWDRRAGALTGDGRRAAERQLAVCEGSDWFWWFGEHNAPASVADFEQLYRHQLAALYRLIGEAPPDYLDRPFTHGRGAPERGGVMRPGQPPA